MKTYLFLALTLCPALPLAAQHWNKAETAIRTVMKTQEQAWNAGDLEGFMAGYWQSDSLRFIGARGLTCGWRQTLANYQKGYPDRAAMGTLTFTIGSVERLSARSAFVIGQWQLTRSAGNLSGYYTLLWKKIQGKWVIVADHSS